jgi:hypothetical protein
VSQLPKGRGKIIEFKTSLNYTARPCLKKPNNKNKKHTKKEMMTYGTKLDLTWRVLTSFYFFLDGCM